MATLRFLLDENIHPGVAEAAWEMDLDVVSVHDLRRRGRSDYEQLEFAAQQDRVLVTRNRGDYLHWTREFYHAGRAHRGVLLLESGLPNDQPAMIARALRRWAQAHSHTGEDDVGFGAYHVDFLKR
jgi:predicted nuclease of predicted toxin-antitoxin system